MPETTRSPKGEYPHSAAVHQLNLESEAEKLVQRLGDHSRQSESLARESGVSVVMMAMQSGDDLPEHAADGVVTVQLVRGRVSVSANDETLALQPGHMLVFQPGVRHALHAEEQSVVLLIVTGGAA